MATLGYKLDAAAENIENNTISQHHVTESAVEIYTDNKFDGREEDEIKQKIHVFCESKKKRASAKGIFDCPHLTVLKGSRVSDYMAPSFETGKPQNFNLRNELVKDGTIKDNVFTRDYEFDSPSAASSVILGGSSSGYRYWKTEDGTPLSKTYNKS